MARPIGHERLGLLHDDRRRARHPLHAGVIARPATTGAAIGPAPICSATRSSPSTPRRASTAGTSRPCTTTCGTSTCRRRRCWSTSSARAEASRRWRRSARPATCSSSTASPASPSSASRSGPCRRGNVPDEWYSPTQPFPVKPAQPVCARHLRPGARHGASRRHVGHSTWPSARRCGTRAAASTTRARITPWLFHEDGAPPRSSVQLPGAGGGVNWGGLAADPRSGLVFINAHDSSLVGWIERKRPGLQLREQHRRFDAAVRPRHRQRTGALLQLHRAAEERDRPRRWRRCPAGGRRGRGLLPSTRIRERSRGRCRSASPRRCPRRSS